jgi:hypothetical protein
MRVLRVAGTAVVASAVVASLAFAAPAAQTASPPAQKQIAALKKQVAALKRQVKDLKGQIGFLNGVLATLQPQVALIPQLAEIAEATGDYRQLANALADGYVHAGVACIPQAGIHYVRQGWPTDDLLDPLRPEFLMYVPSGGGLKLVAVEYAVPMRFSRPTLFGQVFQRYAGGPGESIWYLHVWLWQLNPAGVFSDMNSSVEC